ncbi:MAG: hypothetical protein KA319_07815 [Ferruginibacter sp.]|nr:hypothetical protein [Ferruginibacter sp.]
MKSAIKIYISLLFLIFSIQLRAQNINDKLTFDNLLKNYRHEIIFKSLVLYQFHNKKINTDSIINNNYGGCLDHFIIDSSNVNTINKFLQSYQGSITKVTRREINMVEKFCYVDKLIGALPVLIKENNEDILPFRLFENIIGLNRIIEAKIGDRPYSSMASCESYELYNDILIYISKQKNKNYAIILSTIFKNYAKLL